MAPDPQPDSGARAGDIYGPLLADYLSAEVNHKTSIEQRGLAVITTSGVLVSLLVALSALVLGKDTTEFLNGPTRALLVAAVLVFVVAAGFGLAVNAPGRYWGLSDDDLERIVEVPSWNAEKEEAALLVGQQRVAELKRAVSANDNKAALLQRGIGAEVVGVALVAAAVTVALVT
jgi:hypothetical protein